MNSLTVYTEVIKKRQVNRWMIWPVIRDIHCMLQRIPERKIHFVKRNANKAADWVASQVMRGCAILVGSCKHHPL